MLQSCPAVWSLLYLTSRNFINIYFKDDDEELESAYSKETDSKKKVIQTFFFDCEKNIKKYYLLNTGTGTWPFW